MEDQGRVVEMKRPLADRPVWPMQLSTSDDGGKTVFRNEMVGGLTVKQYMAVEFLAAMMSNPNLLRVSASDMRRAALESATNFCRELEESECASSN